MLTLSQISKSYGGRVLFQDVSLQVCRGDRIGLVGPNGAGKSTLFSIILGELSPDDGSVSLEKRATVGFLPQESAPAGDETVIDLATAVTPEIADLRARLREYEEGNVSDAGPDEYHQWRERFAVLGGFDIEPRAKKILSGLAFGETDFDRPAKTLSGGWIMRIHLARLLTSEPDLLMLDEPTNHLDLESLLWFQNYLRGYPGAILIISHDREFLNQLAESIVEIRHGRLERYRGNYDSFLEQRAARAAQQQAAWENQQKQVRRLQNFVDRFGAKATKAAQAQSKLKQIARIEETMTEQPLEDAAGIRFKFPQPPRSGLQVITLDGIHHAYGDLVVYRGIDFALERGDRIVFVGPNGAGKSTLLKILAGVLPVQKGSRELGLNVKAGYYSQQRVEMLDPSRTVLEEAGDTPHAVGEGAIRTLLGSFLFRDDDVFKKVAVLSGGEKSRLALVKLLLDPPNLLLMDEPTTHLDMASIEALTAALESFEGTLAFISHDVHFIRSIARHVLHVSDGKLTRYAGGYDYYLEKSRADSARTGLTAGGPSTSAHRPSSFKEPSEASPHFKSREQRRQEALDRQETARERRQWEERAEALEQRIIALEEKQAALTRELESPATYANAGRAREINLALAEIVDELASATAEWESLAVRLA